MFFGGKGVILVLVNIIFKKVYEMVKKCLDNNFKEVLDI